MPYLYIALMFVAAVAADVLVTSLLSRRLKPQPLALPFLVVRVPAWWSPVRTQGLSDYLKTMGITNVIVPENREHVVAEWVTPPVNVTITTQETVKKELR